MSNNLTLMDKLRIAGKLKGVQAAMQTKDSTKIIVAVISLLTLVAQTGWMQHIVKTDVAAHPALAVALVGITKILLTLYNPQPAADVPQKREQ